MRISPHEIAAIKAATARAFGPNAVVRLFGSRVDDERRGGNIDLLVEVEPDVATTHNESRFCDYLFASIDEQKVDLVIVPPRLDAGSFARLVARDAVTLP